VTEYQAVIFASAASNAAPAWANLERANVPVSCRSFPKYLADFGNVLPLRSFQAAR